MNNLSYPPVNICKYGLHELSLLGKGVPTALSLSHPIWKTLFTHMVSGPDIDSPADQLLHPSDVIPAGGLMELPLQRKH